MTFRLAIWDVDGTLLDSRAVITTAMDIAFEATGLPPPGYERARQVVGLSLDHAIEVIAPPGLEAGERRALVAAYKAAFLGLRNSANHPEVLYPGAADTLTSLAADGWVFSIATGKARRGLDHFLGAHPELAPLFTSLHCADDGPGKPHPFMIEEALRATGADRARAVMIGDTAHDIGMAKAAGVRGLGVTWGFHTRSEIAASGADEIHDDFGDLAQSLRAFAAAFETLP